MPSEPPSTLVFSIIQVLAAAHRTFVFVFFSLISSGGKKVSQIVLLCRPCCGFFLFSFFFLQRDAVRAFSCALFRPTSSGFVVDPGSFRDTRRVFNINKRQFVVIVFYCLSPDQGQMHTTGATTGWVCGLKGRVHR